MRPRDDDPREGFVPDDLTPPVLLPLEFTLLLTCTGFRTGVQSVKGLEEGLGDGQRSDTGLRVHGVVSRVHGQGVHPETEPFPGPVYFRAK